MATELEKFDSTGGFSIDKTTVVDELRNGKDFNSLEIKNSHPSTKIILTSVSSVEKLKPETKNVINGFIGKPYNSEKIDDLFTLIF